MNNEKYLHASAFGRNTMKINDPFPTTEEILFDLSKRSLSKPKTNWWIVVTRRSIGAYQTRIEADTAFNYFSKNAIDQKAYVLSTMGELLEVTLSFDVPKAQQKSLWTRLLESFNSLI